MNEQQIDLFTQGESYGLSLLTINPDPTLVADEHGKIVAANQTAQDMFGTHIDKLITWNIEKLIPRQYRSTHKYLKEPTFQQPGTFKIRNQLELLSKSLKKTDREVRLSFAELNRNQYAIISFLDISKQNSIQKSLEQTEKILEQTILNLGVGACHLSLGGKFKVINKKLESLLGFKKRQFMSKTFMDIIHTSEIEYNLNKIEELLSGKVNTYKTEVRLNHSMGHNIWAQLTISLIFGKDNKPSYFLAIIEDINSRKIFDKLLRESEQKFRTIVESLSEDAVVALVDPEVKSIQSVNKGFENIWGVKGEPFYDNPAALMDTIHPGDKLRVSHFMQNLKNTNRNIDYRILLEGGETRYIRQAHHAITYDDDIEFFVLIANDVTKDVLYQMQLEETLCELQSANQQLTILSRTDALTQILNRQAVQEEARKEIKRFKRYKLKSTLIFIDLVDFKIVNDTHGHLAGDRTLQHCANQLKSIIRNTDSLGRYGGDEFIILLPNTSYEDAEVVARKIKSTPFTLEHENTEITVKMSVGISEIDESMEDEVAWLRSADNKMYEHKTASKAISQTV